MPIPVSYRFPFHFDCRGGAQMKMPSEIDPKMFAPCGMNCMVCYKHCFAKNPKQRCGGCMADHPGKPAHCRSCKIKDCAAAKGLTHCYACGGFPCRLIRNLEKSYNQRYGESLIENSRTAQAFGVAHLLSLHRKKYRCTKRSSSLRKLNF